MEVITHRQLQDLAKLPFCYSCAKPFVAADGTPTRDHVPAKASFETIDRIRPLILPTHAQCNASYKVQDERVGTFIALRRGRSPARKAARLSLRRYTDPQTGEPHVAVDNVDIRGALERWVRASHAALYREPLAAETRFGIETPFHTAAPSPNGVTLDRGRQPQHLLFVKEIKHNRQLRQTDRLVTNNGKYVYECVWVQASNGNWLCIFALDIYDWKDLGRLPATPAKGCVGFYQYLLASPPEMASRGSQIESLASNFEPFDPFGA